MLRAPIVAEAFPRLPHGLGPGLGQGSDGGVARQERLVILLHAGNLRLLEHELRHQHPIRVPRATPRKVAPLAAKPGQQAALEGEGVSGGFDRHSVPRYAVGRRGERGVR